MKILVPKLSRELFETKIKIEEEFEKGDKSDEELYSLILKAIEFLKLKRKGEPISKKLLIYKYF